MELPRLHCSFVRKRFPWENFVTGILTILSGVAICATLGYFYIDLALDFLIWRSLRRG